MSKFILLLHEGPNAFPPDISPDQIQAIIQRYVAWRQKVQQNGRKVEGHKLTDGEGRVMKGVGGIRQGHRRPVRRSPRSDRRPLHCRSEELRRSRRVEQGLPAPRFRHHRDSRGRAHVGSDLAECCSRGLTPTRRLVDHLFRRQAGQMVATLTRRLGSRHLAVAEDAVQDALMTALQQWPFRGVPDQPEAWLFQVAKNRALDRLRHARMAADKAPAVALETATSTAPAVTQTLLRDELPPVEDDQLGLIFLVCHPSLPADARVALALKLAGGFSVGEIARAFLVAGQHDRAAPGARQARASRMRRRLRHARARRARGAPGFGARVALPDVQRRLCRHVRRSARARRCRRGSHSPGASRGRAPGHDRAARLGVGGADAAARRPLSGARRFGWHACSCFAIRIAASGTGTRSRRACARSTAPRPATRSARFTSKPASPPAMRWRRPGRRPIGRRSSGCTTSCSRSRGRRWWP